MSHCKNWMGQCGPNVATDGRIRRKFKVRQEPNFEPKNNPVSHDGELIAKDVQPANIALPQKNACIIHLSRKLTALVCKDLAPCGHGWTHYKKVQSEAGAEL